MLHCGNAPRPERKNVPSKEVLPSSSSPGPPLVVSTNKQPQNVRGIHNTPTLNHIKFLCKSHHIQILAVMEPITTADIPSFCKKLGFQHGVSNKAKKFRVFWNSNFFATHLRDCDQILDLEFTSVIFPFTFTASFVYAKSTRIERRNLWDVIRSAAILFDHKPWLIGDDFNYFLTPDERVGSTTDRHLDMDEFGQMVSDSGLIDIGFEGDSMHTWSRCNLQERLDRIFLNLAWTDAFPKSFVNHLPRVKSDHAPLLFQSSLTITRHPTTFRYMKMWSRHHSFQLNTVAQTWSSPTGLTSMLNLHCKLMRVKHKLQWWNKTVFGNIFDNLKHAEAEKAYDANPTPTLLSDYNKASAELVLATIIEEDLWHQKSSCKCIVEGERNTKYFP
ncbi:hypothetical protein DH2020_003265 [Rehmannia glutinosa]|uniref:Endonuclease/exonuclease/phosphatase domain-containing protein n=1 Tax=Rehmannia glutinosa TaxID=99300 RepID=A0ABR0XL36_REHGL